MPSVINLIFSIYGKRLMGQDPERRRLDNWRLIMQWHPENQTRNENWDRTLAAGINWPARYRDASPAIRPARRDRPGKWWWAVGTAGKVRINGPSQDRATVLSVKLNYTSFWFVSIEISEMALPIKNMRYYLKDEVVCHNKKNDIWVIIHTNVFDLTEMLKDRMDHWNRVGHFPKIFLCISKV